MRANQNIGTYFNERIPLSTLFNIPSFLLLFGYLTTHCIHKFIDNVPATIDSQIFNCKNI